MINPFDYLYYKIYSALSCIDGGGEPVHHAGATSVFFVFNILAICTLITNALPSGIVIWGVCGSVFILVPICYPRNYRKKILAKYSRESLKSRVIGNFVVISYVILSIVSFFLVMRHYIKN